MTQVLWGVLLLSLATGAPGEGKTNMGSSAAHTPVAESHVVAATGATESHVQPAKAARSTGKASESYKADSAK